MRLGSPDQCAALLGLPVAGRCSALELSSKRKGAASHRVMP